MLRSPTVAVIGVPECVTLGYSEGLFFGLLPCRLAYQSLASRLGLVLSLSSSAYPLDLP